MTPEQILKIPTRILSQSQREHYFEFGYVSLEDFVPPEIIENLLQCVDSFVELSRSETVSGGVFDIGPGHSSEKPQVRRLKMPDDRDPVFWELARGLITDVAADLVGPDVVFHHSKLNFKWYDESNRVKWHQDAQFFPDTNYNVLTIGCYLSDTTMQNGPLAVLPGSHNGPLFNQYDESGNWSGSLNETDAAAIDMNDVAYLTGRAGSITAHNCRELHFSPTSKSPTPRPLLLNTYTSADARPYTPHPGPSSHAYEIVAGKPARWAHHDPRPCLVPPDWSGGYTSIYAAQAK
jgi:ectoine hydroxylase